MPEYDNTNRGVLFAEMEKKNPKAPDMTGKLDVNGHEYRIVGWKRRTKDGRPMLALSIEEPRQAKSKPAPAQPGPEPFNDDIPW